jgi:hypothetical protein
MVGNGILIDKLSHRAILAKPYCRLQHPHVSAAVPLSLSSAAVLSLLSRCSFAAGSSETQDS